MHTYIHACRLRKLVRGEDKPRHSSCEIPTLSHLIVTAEIKRFKTFLYINLNIQYDKLCWLIEIYIYVCVCVFVCLCVYTYTALIIANGIELSFRVEISAFSIANVRVDP